MVTGCLKNNNFKQINLPNMYLRVYQIYLPTAKSLNPLSKDLKGTCRENTSRTHQPAPTGGDAEGTLQD